ncbi:hypothetical protein HPB49_003315 [Dermacentor silvarum]|uniref:Uncharacterized protein n=1 Tax=Dermacentor silvarum TaxID=543639 RepID=A0ACB8DB30_DERSI|nr:hypothetical protein HPB49_003315 [Dermacentor silvarum]
MAPVNKKILLLHKKKKLYLLKKKALLLQPNPRRWWVRPSWQNRKTDSEFYTTGNYSIVLMAVVDNQLRFVCIDVGAYGSQSDGGVFKASKIGKLLSQGRRARPNSAARLLLQPIRFQRPAAAPATPRRGDALPPRPSFSQHFRRLAARCVASLDGAVILERRTNADRVRWSSLLVLTDAGHRHDRRFCSPETLSSLSAP